jgi:hypothetical protein
MGTRGYGHPQIADPSSRATEQRAIACIWARSIGQVIFTAKAARIKPLVEAAAGLHFV